MKKTAYIVAAALALTASLALTACGGAAGEISVVSREDGSGTRGEFIELFGIVERRDDGGRRDRTTKEAIITSKTDVMMTSIAGDRDAVGYISLGSLNDTVKAVDIEGVPATAETVKSGTYPVTRPFYIATRGTPGGLAADFIGYILSKEGQRVVAGSYIAVDDGASAYSGTRPGGKIVVAGSSSVSPIMEKLKEAYAAINTNAAIEIQMSDSSSGMSAVMSGTCDIGMASRELTGTELSGLTPTQIAIDGIAVIVNRENAVSDLTREQVRGIFTGETTTWDAVS
jgi:phosphate transport system substrate-binding protein